MTTSGALEGCQTRPRTGTDFAELKRREPPCSETKNNGLLERDGRRMPPASWSSTLCLPKSRFPPRTILADRNKYLKRCTDDLYAWQRSTADPSPTNSFTLHDGPPYANGSLHIGHALNKILKDITCRFHVSSGRRVDYKPGWDCHGLPIELKALQRHKEQGGLGKDRPPGFLEVRKLARELASDTVEDQKAGFREWAVMADWDNSWKTMDKEFELRQLGVFRSLVEKGLIYRKFKPVYWSPSSRTALAEAELEYKNDHVSTAAFVKFPLSSLPKDIGDRLETPVSEICGVIWTTTPWTLIANKAIVVSPALEYVLVRSSQHGVLLLAKTRLNEMSSFCKENLDENILAICRGSGLVGGTYINPALGSACPSLPILQADFVSAESGSGLVHVAPGHGMDDYKLCLENGIEPYAPVDDDGCFTKEALSSDPERLLGKEVLGQGNGLVLQLFAENNMLIASHKYSHKYPYDWRSKQPVITRATQQWFANVGEIRDDALKVLDQVRFVPESGQERLSSFVKSRSEWCISRQRAWGVPIPALFEKYTGSAVLTPESVFHIIQVIKERGIEAWWTDDEYDLAWVPPTMRDRAQLRRGKDTMDVWFDSGTSWTQLQDGDREGHPPVADIYLEGTDQHRGWFQSSLLTHVAKQSSNAKTAPVAPYRTLVTHGFILDQLGRKMSKSEGNVVSPSEVMDGTLLPPLKRRPAKNSPNDEQVVVYDAMGPDALRLWVAGCDYTRDVSIGQPILKAVNNGLLKLRNTFKLLLGLVETLQPDRKTRFESLGSTGRMALMQLAELETEVQRAYSRFEYHKAVATINQYVNIDLSASYIESIKDCLYADATNSESRIEAQLVLWEIFKGLSCILSPITPLLVQEAIDYLPAQLDFQPTKVIWGNDPSALQNRQISSVAGPWEDPLLKNDMAYLSAVRNTIKSIQERVRAEKKMGSSLQCCVSISFPSASSNEQIPFPHSFRLAIERNLPSLEDYLVVSKVSILAPSHDIAETTASENWARSADVTVNGETATVHIREPEEAKCGRCWKYNVSTETAPKPEPSSSVLAGQKPNVSQPELQELEEPLCERCLGVLEGMRSSKLDIFEDRPKIDAAARKCRKVTNEKLMRHWDLK